MGIQRANNTRLIIAGYTDLKRRTAFARQSYDISIFKHTHAMTDSLCTQLFNRFFYIVRGAPFTGMNSYMQTRLAGLLDQSVKWLGLEFSLIPRQVNCHHSI